MRLSITACCSASGTPASVHSVERVFCASAASWDMSMISKGAVSEGGSAGEDGGEGPRWVGGGVHPPIFFPFLCAGLLGLTSLFSPYG